MNQEDSFVDVEALSSQSLLSKKCSELNKRGRLLHRLYEIDKERVELVHQLNQGTLALEQKMLLEQKREHRLKFQS